MRAFAWIAVLGLLLWGTVWAVAQEQRQMPGRGGMMGGGMMGQGGMGGGMMGRGGMMGAKSSTAQTAGAAASNYSSLCASCHGANGKGDGPAAAALNPKPKDFTDCKSMAKESDETLFKIIKGGSQSVGRSPMMPAWGGALTDQQIKELATYIRSFCKKK